MGAVPEIFNKAIRLSNGSVIDCFQKPETPETQTGNKSSSEGSNASAMLSLDDWAAFAFKEEEHLRKKKGTEGGGQFVKQETSGGVKTLKHGPFKVKVSHHERSRIEDESATVLEGMPHYKQHDEHSCSFIAALAAVHYFDKNISAKEVLKAVKPTKSGGLNRVGLQRALKKLGYNATYKDDLTINKIRKHIEYGRPVLLTIFPEDWGSDHWTTVRGVSDDRVYLSNYKSLTHDQFKDEWFDKGEGLIVTKKDVSLSVDKSGHEHKGRGKGGGQFTKKSKQDETETTFDEKHWPKGDDFVVIHREGTQTATTGVASGDEGGYYVRDNGGEIGPYDTYEEALEFGSRGGGVFKGRFKGKPASDVSFSIDKTGRQHAEKGTHEGGQFIKKAATRGKMVEAKRVGEKKDAKVILANGKPAPAHIKPAMVPPDWTDVQVSLDPKADLLVTARDNKGRAKFVYAADFHMRNAAVKFARVDEMIRKGDKIDKQIQAARKGDNKEHADCAWLMSVQATRPGSQADTGAKVKAYGATTLEGRHIVVLSGGVRLRFVGKEGVKHNHIVRDMALAKMLVDRAKKAGSKGKLFDTTEQKVNAFIKTLDGGDFTAKDFRTRRANLLAVNAMKNMRKPKTMKQYKKQVKQVAERVAHVLGNKPSQCLTSYINPAVFAAWKIDE